MDFHSYTTMRDWTRRADPNERSAQDIDQFYRRAILDAQKMGSGQFFGQMHNERDWEKARRPYYNLWPSIVPISPDVLADDRAKFEASGDQKFVDKAHRRGKIGWDVGKHIEVIPHFRRPHMTLVWTGSGRAVPRIVSRRGSIVHREAVEKLPSGFGG